MTKIIEITNGPSREELFDGLRLISEKRLVPFCVKQNNSKEEYVAVNVQSIEAEDGSGQSWNIIISIKELFLSDTFYTCKSEKNEVDVTNKKIDFDGFRKMIELDLCKKHLKNLVRVKAYYSTKIRKGQIIVERVLPKIYMRRILMHNEVVNDESVRNLAYKVIGNINNIAGYVVEGVANYKAFVVGSGFQQPQTDVTIKVFYTKKVS